MYNAEILIKGLYMYIKTQPTYDRQGYNYMITALIMFVCLFVMRVNVQVNNFSVMSGQSHRFLHINSSVR